ncbi:PREDICTED: uncharacterized protein LOC104605916 isoform X2 [Nelumbo nucifera]|uniref:Uncharacterized protein LOC104605916 isoform X2 n=1 Tax=Nelumbo nucifera TaxID=4432 RepID=A0A1U8Q7H6_NELNU|nr:PREDICTED: uncharacterized protein LOC104605916 isoform X2 [Nelumbo nucifera]
MMGVGSLGTGGSSSSNLSPLAPPFTIDRSATKSKTNTLVHFTEEPYPYPYNKPSSDNWLHLHPPSSVPDSFSSPIPEPDTIHTTGNYGYFGGQSMSSFGIHGPSLRPSAATSSSSTTGAFAYGQHSETARSGFLEAKPYYPQYPVAALPDDVSSVVFTESGSDVLPSSSVAPLSGSSKTDYAQTLSGLGYSTEWSGFWNGPSDEEQRRWKELEGSLFWKESGSSTNKNLLKQGASASGYLTANQVESLAGQSPLGSKGTGWLDSRLLPLSEENVGVAPFNISRTPVLNPSTCQEVPIPQLDSFTTDPAGMYPSFKISSPCLASSSAANFSIPMTNPSKNFNSSGKLGDAFGNNELPYDHNFSNAKKPLIQLIAKGKEGYDDANQISNSIEGNNHIFVEPSIKKDEQVKHNTLADDSIDDLLNSSELQTNPFKLPTALLAPDRGKGYIEGPFETFDQHNPAEDSPCWKGAPTSRRSPFGVTSQFVQEFEGSNNLGLKHCQILPANVDNVAAISSQEVEGSLVHYKSGSLAGGSSSLLKGSSYLVGFQSTENIVKDDVEVRNCHSKGRTGNEIQGTGDIQELGAECLCTCSKSFSSELQNCHMEQLNHAVNITSAEQDSVARVHDPMVEIKDAVQDGSSHVLLHSLDHTSSSACSAGVPTELTEPLGASNSSTESSLQKLDLSVVVNALNNLSELLLSSCSNGMHSLRKVDHESLQHVSNNLESCLSKLGLVKAVPQLQSAQPNTTYLPRAPTKESSGKSRSTLSYGETNEQDSHSAHEGKMHTKMTSKKEDKLQDFVFWSDGIDYESNNDMTQAIKKILEENLDEEEMHPQALLYKNLWLEAEAALCSMKYKARVACMKMKMEKCKSHLVEGAAGKPSSIEQLNNVPCETSVGDVRTLKSEEGSAAGVAGKSTNMEKQLISKVPRDSSVGATRTPMNEGGSTVDIFAQDVTHSSNGSGTEDVEASVMARFHILKCRVDNSNSRDGGERLSNQTKVGTYVGMEKTMSCPCPSDEQDFGLKPQATKVVDMGFGESRNPWPFIRERMDSGETLRHDMEHHIRNFHTESKIDLENVSERGEKVKEFGVCVSEPTIECSMVNRPGDQCPANGYDSSSLDWEHVLKDELTR